VRKSCSVIFLVFFIALYFIAETIDFDQHRVRNLSYIYYRKCQDPCFDFFEWPSQTIESVESGIIGFVIKGQNNKLQDIVLLFQKSASQFYKLQSRSAMLGKPLQVCILFFSCILIE